MSEETLVCLRELDDYANGCTLLLPFIVLGDVLADFSPNYLRGKFIRF